MKLSNLLYYLFIFASMMLSAVMAPAMFIQQNALAGWLWALVFLVMLFSLFSEAIDTATARPLTERQKEKLFLQITNIIVLEFARKCLRGLEPQEATASAGTPANEARRNHFGRQ